MRFSPHALVFLCVVSVSSSVVQGWNLASQQYNLHHHSRLTTMVCQMAQHHAEQDSHHNNNHESNGSGEEEGQKQPHRQHQDSSEQQHEQNLTSLQAKYEAAAERRFKLAKAQADIDRILNNPVDPPFDLQAELKKVVSISSPDPNHPDSILLEDQVSTIEEDLYQAVKEQDFQRASQKQQEISQLHVDDCGLVLQKNSKFYQAFSSKSFDDMKNIWLPDRSCVCIHPSQKPLMGIRDILISWQRMFNHASGGFQKTWMEPQQIRLTVKGTMAIVTCEEHVFTRRFVRGQKRQTELVNKLQASNVFRKIGNQWYMTYHHSSWHADSESAKLALKAGNGGTKSIQTNTDKNNNGLQSKRLVVRGRLSPSDVDPDNDAVDNLESILGIKDFGPVLGDENNNDGNDPNKPGVRRIVLGGSLSDILNGDLGELLKGGEGGSIDGSNNGPNMMGMNNNLKDILGGGDENDGAIIQYRRLEDGEEDEEDEDDDDDDEDDDDIEAHDGEESVEMLKQWANKSSPSQPSQKKFNNNSNKNPKKKHDSLRQNCISALRKLTNEGRISLKQKRVLLTDIISCSTKGEYSMVEVAYELLLAETSMNVGGEDDADGISCEEADDAEEEFADQCRVFAQNFAD